MQIQNPVSREKFWICPGGGIQENEDLSSALKRELKEELGLIEFQAHHQVHKRHHTFNWKDKRISQREVFYIVHVEKFNPIMSDEVEAQVLQEFRWWKLEEIDTEKFSIAPKTIQSILKNYLEKGAPQEELEFVVELD